MKRLGSFLLLAVAAIHAQNAPEPVVSMASITPPLTAREKVLNERVGELRSLPDDAWTKEVGALATEIQQLPFSKGKQWLIDSISGRATEGDAGRAALQVIADTIVQTANDLPVDQRDWLYDRLARLVRYEHVEVAVDNPHYRAELAKLEANDRARKSVEFTLSDLKGRRWTLRELRGKVVLVNFWATWCPPCRREMPDMQALYERFSQKGLVILAITYEDARTVEPFIAEQKYSYPVLLDPGNTVKERFNVEGIPQSFVYNRAGKLVAQAFDRRTSEQFLEMLKQAGLK